MSRAELCRSYQNRSDLFTRKKELRPVRDFSPSMLLFGDAIFVLKQFSPLPCVATFCDVITCKPYNRYIGSMPVLGQGFLKVF